MERFTPRRKPSDGGVFPSGSPLKHVYGPVVSRRLGRSLGIDPVPLKVCNWDCVYCQLGRTRTHTRERKDFTSPTAILEELATALDRLGPDTIDHLTVVGSGETLLYAGLGELLAGAKARSPCPVAVITNGSLLYRPEVRRELASADIILPSLDAGDAELYKVINRPHADLSFDLHLEGLCALRDEFQKEIWIEIMLVQGLNDTPEALQSLANLCKLLRPDRVHLNVPNRPPVEPWVRAPDEEGLMRACALLGKAVTVLHPAEQCGLRAIYENVEEAILAITQRHPMDRAELERTLSRWTPGVIGSALETLSRQHRIQAVERFESTFWSSPRGRYSSGRNRAPTVEKVGGND